MVLACGDEVDVVIVILIKSSLGILRTVPQRFSSASGVSRSEIALIVFDWKRWLHQG